VFYLPIAGRCQKEKVVYNAPYNNERMFAYLFLPKNVSPPFQAIVYFPDNGAQQSKTSENIEVFAVQILTRSGRAVLYPVYEGTYERGGGSILDPSATAGLADDEGQGAILRSAPFARPPIARLAHKQPSEVAPQSFAGAAATGMPSYDLSARVLARLGLVFRGPESTADRPRPCLELTSDFSPGMTGVAKPNN
jgi:hypothetical protein